MTKRNYLWLLLVLVGGVLAFSGYATSVSKASFIYPTGPIEGKSHYFAIAENGLAKCCMVIPATPQKEEVAAARMLQIYLQLATGATFSSYKETAIPSGLNQIHVGETKLGLATPLDLPSLQYDGLELPHVNGYLIKTVNPHQLVIRGASPQANVLGAVGLLKRYFGIRRYWPGEPGGIGDVVPKQADLQFPQIEWKDWPYFVSRIMSGLDNRGPKSTQRTRFADFWRMNYTIPSNESYYRLLNARERTNEPDVFPLINGKRHVPHFEPGKREPQGWQPCVSNPKVAEIMAEAIKEYFRANPDKFAVSLSVNDGLGDCTCEKCRAMDAPNADIVNRIGLCDRYIKTGVSTSVA